MSAEAENADAMLAVLLRIRFMLPAPPGVGSFLEAAIDASDTAALHQQDGLAGLCPVRDRDSGFESSIMPRDFAIEIFAEGNGCGLSVQPLFLQHGGERVASFEGDGPVAVSSIGWIDENAAGFGIFRHEIRPADVRRLPERGGDRSGAAGP